MSAGSNYVDAKTNVCNNNLPSELMSKTISLLKLKIARDGLEADWKIGKKEETQKFSIYFSGYSS